jgi:nucleoside-diphosphate-sugar epimerase
LPLIVPRAACLVFEALQALGLRRKPVPINRAGLRFLGTSRWVDIDRARKELEYSPKVQFREGLAETLEGTGENADERTAFAHAPR